ncbi:hypothetical protein COOONC_25161, partial [Cooperia oncophora]
LKLPSGHIVRRPVNALVPLELEDTENESPSSTPQPDPRISSEDREPTSRYELRPRRRVNYSEMTTVHSSAHSIVSRNLPVSFLLTCVTALMLTAGGVAIIAHNVERYELCVEGNCQMKESTHGNETIHFPPEVLLHEHHGKVSLLLETSCPPAPFCENIRCWICTANILNPECSPRAAITALAFVLYLSIALVYVLCYVPMIVGKPCRIFGNGICCVMKSIGRLLWFLCCEIPFQRRQRRRYDVQEFLKMPLLAIVSVITLSALTRACQDIDSVPIHQLELRDVAWRPPKVMKFNSYNQEACLRLLTNQTTQKEVRIQWKGLRLKCVKEEVVFTRNTIQRVVDSKRCAHTGSCTGNKCASINMSSLLPELTQGNQYPGITKCIESCGGPGCGCFYLSSGCLYYRIFHMPIDAKVYEIFGCAQWKEEVELEVTTITRSAVRKRTFVDTSYCTYKHEQHAAHNHCSHLPPTTALSSRFISDELPNPLCESWDDANSLINCTVASNCDCDPAETTGDSRTDCLSATVGLQFTAIKKRIPTSGQQRELPYVFVSKQNYCGRIKRDKFDDTITVVTNPICTITNTVAKGCYLCPQGAEQQR